jgi:hypothetical protein
MQSNKIKYLKSRIGIRLWPFCSLKVACDPLAN